MTSRSLIMAPLAAFALCTCAHALAAEDPPPVRSAPLLHASEAFQRGEHGLAFDRFSALANKGDADAARIALLMHQHGPALFGRYWSVSPAEAQRWQRLAAQPRPRR